MFSLSARRRLRIVQLLLADHFENIGPPTDCVAALGPSRTVKDQLRKYACAAAFEDPRFKPLSSEAELSTRRCNVSLHVLLHLKPKAARSHWIPCTDLSRWRTSRVVESCLPSLFTFEHHLVDFQTVSIFFRCTASFMFTLNSFLHVEGKRVQAVKGKISEQHNPYSKRTMRRP
ncbi:Hypothetical protein, putative, partial [Bodo saltans]